MVYVCTCQNCGIVVRIQDGQNYVVCACQAPYDIVPEDEE